MEVPLAAVRRTSDLLQGVLIVDLGKREQQAPVSTKNFMPECTSDKKNTSLDFEATAACGDLTGRFLARHMEVRTSWLWVQIWHGKNRV